jgi:hypothetical protein
MIDLIDQTLKSWRQTVFVWSETDCLASIGTYLVDCGLPDAFRDFRRTYSTEAEAFKLLDEYGGPQGFIDMFGQPRIAPERLCRGDIAVIDPMDGIERYGVAGICTGPGIAVRGERKVIEVDRKFVTIKFAWDLANVIHR